jgi:hypothetical protein
MPPGSASTRYELAPQFAIRMAGVAFDVLAAAATPRALALAREWGAAAEAVERLAPAALDVLARDTAAAGSRIRAHLQREIAKRRVPSKLPPDPAPEVRAWADAAAAAARLRAAQREALDGEEDATFRALRRAALRFLPEYALFASPTVEDLASDIRADGEWAPERLDDARRDRTLLMYVQRVATKNETLSAYGPLSWGTVDPALRGVRLAPRPGLRREAFLERWVADAVVAAMNADPATRAEVSPRLHPDARLDDGALVRLDTGARVALDAEARALLARCDGRTPAYALGAPERLEALARDGAIVWSVECPRYVLDRLGVLHAQVSAWRDGAARRRWAPPLAALSAVPGRFAAEGSVAARRGILAEARRLLDAAGAGPPAQEGQRALYRGSNVVGEKCARPPALALGADVARDLAERVAPWLDVWRDTYAFAAHRANERLRAVHSAVAGRGGAAPLPAFLAACKAAGLPLDGIGIPALGALAFAEVRAAFREALAGRPDARVWSLGPEDAAFLRRRFEFPRFDPLTWPSADLQLSAASAEDVPAGRHQWVLAELHYAGTLLQHGVAFAAPDPRALDPWLRRASGPLCDWGFPTDVVAHTLLDFAPVGDLFTYAGPDRGLPGWRAYRPADAEVVVAGDGDVRIRAGGEERGSFARSWIIGLGFHPFTFPLGAHSPRLETGGVVVQREGWVVTSADLPRGPYASGAPELAVDVDRLRAARGLPRHVFVRPTDAAVRRVGAGGRDKDVKPIFVDLESYPFLDVLARWLAKHGELDVTEMLPAPDRLCWREDDGRHTFELRTLFVGADR